MSSQVPGPVPPPSEPTPPGYGAPAPTPPPGYGYPPQPGYGAPGQGGYGGGGFPPQPPQNNGGGGGKTGLIIAIIVAIVLLVAGAATALILVLTGGDDDSDDRTDDDTTTETDEGYLTAVEDYFAAYDDGDCDTILDLYPDQFDDVEACEDEYPYSDPDDVEIDISSLEATDVDDEADPTEATVEVSFTEVDLEGDTEDDYTVEFTLEKDGDDWVIVEYDSI